MKDDEKAVLTLFVPALVAYLRDLMQRSGMPLTDKEARNLLGKIGALLLIENTGASSLAPLYEHSDLD